MRRNRNKLTWRVAVRVFAIAVLTASYVVMTLEFIVAYFFSDGKYRVMIHINDYGEAHIELMMILAAAPAIVFIMWEYMRLVEPEPVTEVD